MMPPESVAEHSSRLQPSINLHASFTAFMPYAALVLMYYPEGMKARISLVAIPSQQNNGQQFSI